MSLVRVQLPEPRSSATNPRVCGVFYPKNHFTFSEKIRPKNTRIQPNIIKKLYICYTGFFQLLANPLYQDLQGFHNFQKWVTYGTSGSLSPLYICYISTKNIYLREKEQMTGLSAKNIDECDNLKRIVYEIQTFLGN